MDRKAIADKLHKELDEHTSNRMRRLELEHDYFACNSIARQEESTEAQDIQQLFALIRYLQRQVTELTKRVEGIRPLAG